MISEWQKENEPGTSGGGRMNGYTLTIVFSIFTVIIGVEAESREQAEKVAGDLLSGEGLNIDDAQEVSIESQN